MKWYVYLTGDNDILRRLAEILYAPDLEILKEADDFVLTSSAWDGMLNHEDVYEDAQRKLELINGFARLSLGAVASVGYAHVDAVLEGGQRNTFIIPGTAALILKPFPPNEPPDPVPSLLTMTSAPVNKALRLYGSGDFGWVNLYRIYEVIADDVGGEDVLVANAWASRRRISRFKHTANSVAATGDDARHGKELTGTSPTKPLKPQEAKELIDAMLRAWLQTKAQPFAHKVP